MPVLAWDVVGLERAIRKHLSPGGSGVRFSFPLVKSDESSREVVGVATSEDLDAGDEVLEYQGSKAAFQSWLGNLREMHQPVAVGKALAVECDDSRRAISVRAFISKGAESTWQKILDGTLTAYSVGGTRLKSEVRKDGTRVTSQWKMNELSLVDSPANPACRISLVKVLRRDGEMEKLKLGSALEAVAKQLAAGCRPLPHEVTRVLALAGSPVVCNEVAPRDWRVLGPPLSMTLATLARGLRMPGVTEEQVEKIVGVVPRALQPLLPAVGGRPGGAVDARLEKSEGASVPDADALYEEVADGVRQVAAVAALRGMDIHRDLEAALLKVASWRNSGVVPGTALVKRAGPTLAELAAMEEKLTSELQKWHSQNLPQNVPQYRELSATYFRVSQMRKAADRRAMARS